MADEDGASPKELVVEACRRDQPHLLKEVVNDNFAKKPKEEIAAFFNDVTDSMGNYALHICAMYGSYDAMDWLFDVEGFECDPQNRIEKDTPLHLAVRYANEKDIKLGLAMVKMMLEAGCDPRVRNKAGKKPVDFTIPQYKEVKLALQRAEYALQEGVEHEGQDEDSDDGTSGSDGG
ncbi:hypothetical protein D8B26_003220 [Coccidioides posadasii str. Silveira]|uniref:Ankyrin repeat protein n=3 Tax=Coccidioides posadasii TaxID=199306 RepID=E9D0D9_COCPS|nr:ankyrin repeat containing protein [Coccidioides posadasii C735 delta SOWgp]EER26405.1 ankyrin repeat containing protein [Coccidioides posadasii C735 delta SOWgp]EFW20392.1 ankyrin repeat protein [Coccidioides posadasii str. Silveira]KMM73045.1 HRE181 protein [Coccidioides posadasii RMSCC 3488]QVM08531.1 hypothetical protein D8B26_003220 [Coccidioides posadasii str. Silveira]|eukprot:XP_003068550.1 ankyrin repeat containing protein [Coccidioides posadasii C735 delta SOWgp]